MNRLPVIAPPTSPEYGTYEIYYYDRNDDGSLSDEHSREVLTLVTRAQAEKIANAWQLCSWVRGRVYGCRKVEDRK